MLEHLTGTARLAEAFAAAFGAGSWGQACGLAHDIGKYSQAFQRRLLKNGPKVDHATAGAVELSKIHLREAAFCAAGHHGGLPDGGTRVSMNDATLHARLKKALEPYGSFAEEVTLNPLGAPDIRLLEKQGYSLSFFIRMLFSCLVDADYLDTEAFMRPDEQRGAFDGLPMLLERLAPYLDSLLNAPNPSGINQKRNAILRACMEGADNPVGLYALTVPTGGGKTLASLAFALRHAVRHGLERVIYVIPYQSIIEQNAQVFRERLGAKNVVEHHANYDFDADEQNGGMHHLATENWDAPVIVTTNVQFFESLYAAKPGRCRKLHNIARSVIIFDEAQMFPAPFLLPCVRAIGELCANYRCTAVLCTATQPVLAPYFPKGMQPKELCPDGHALNRDFRRNGLQDIGSISDETLAGRLAACKQALCVVNSRKQAQAVVALLPEEGRYHLSTLLYPEHRKALLAEIRGRLEAGLPCRVVSTSLIEAGVDVDFPTVYRARAGLDNILQAAGRCNRNGKRPLEESVVYLFRPEPRYEAHLPASMTGPAAALDAIAPRFADLTAPEAVSAYFTELYAAKGAGLDQHKVVATMEESLRHFSFPFRTVAEGFHLIGEDTRPILIPQGEGQAVADELRQGRRSRELLRRAGRWSVNVYPNHYRALAEAGALEVLDKELSILCVPDYYSAALGLVMEPQGGIGFEV